MLRRLPEFGVCLLPAQLTSLPDKHQLLQRIVFGRHTYAAAAAAASGSSIGSSSSAGSSVAPWRRLGDVLELAALLGFGSDAEQNQVCIQGYCCTAQVAVVHHLVVSRKTAVAITTSFSHVAMQPVLEFPFMCFTLSALVFANPAGPADGSRSSTGCRRGGHCHAPLPSVGCCKLPACMVFGCGVGVPSEVS